MPDLLYEESALRHPKLPYDNGPCLTLPASPIRYSPFAHTCWAIVFIVFCLVARPSFAAVESNPPQRFHHTVAVAYGGELTRAAAAQAAEHMARNGVLQLAASWLENREDIQLLLSGISKNYPEFTGNTLPLAERLFSTMTVEVEEMGQYPEYGVRVTVLAKGPDNLSQKIIATRSHASTLQFLDMANAEFNRHLRKFIRLSTLNAEKIKSKEPEDMLESLKPQFSRVLNQIHAIALYKKILKNLDEKGWKNPQQTIQRVTSALELAPHSILLRHAHATATLQAGKTQEAINELEKIVKQAPAFAEALHSLGSAYLKVHLPKYALVYFNKAIRLRPQNPEYYLSRGSVHLTEENYQPMCNDFFTACSLGLCKSYHWAQSRKLCPEAKAQP